MSAEYTVTRQRQWPEGHSVVEISAGGIDYCNPDALCNKFPGEFETYLGLTPAVEAAITVADAWKADEAKCLVPRKILIAVGATLGMTMPFDGITACKTNYKKLLREAKKHDLALPKCPHCGDILPDDTKKLFGNEHTVMMDNEYPFCSENCANMDQEEWERMEAEELAEVDTN